MTGVLASLAVGLGLVVAFDGLTRPAGGSRWFPGRASPGIVSAIIGAGGAFSLTGWPVAAAAGGALGLAIPKLLADHRSLSQRIELTDALAEAAAGLRDAVKGGLGVSDGIAGLATWGPPRLRDELSILSAEAARAGIAVAARSFADRLGDPGADLLAVTLCFNDRVGGRQVAEVLDAMAEELAAEARTVRELRARQERQRTSARVVAFAPIALLLLLRQVNPDYLDPYGPVTGQTVLGVAALLVGVGYALMLRIARAIEPPRVVVGSGR